MATTEGQIKSKAGITRFLPVTAIVTLIAGFLLPFWPDWQTNVAGILLPSFDIEAFRTNDLPKAEFDALNAITGDLKKSAATIITIFVTIVVSGLQASFFFYDRLKKGLAAEIGAQAAVINGKISESSQVIAPITKGLAEVRDRIQRPGTLQTIKIAIFDKLLIYSPLFVADVMNYFEEEGIKVDFKTVPSDKEISEKVESGEFQFGACDPYYCIENSNGTEESDILILLPLAKRLGLHIVGKKETVAALKDGGRVVIGSYPEGTTTYLAALAFKAWLETNLERKKIKCEVSIDAKPVDHNNFVTPKNLRTAMNYWDFAAIWEPNVSWLIGETGSPDFGVVGIQDGQSTLTDPFLRIFLSERPSGSAGTFAEKNWKAWLPAIDSSEKPHQGLVSALITNRSIIVHEPELARRVFRAVSRANIHLHALDVVEDAARGEASMWSKLQPRLNHGESVNGDAVLPTLVGETRAEMGAGDRGGVIPFVPGISEYLESHYFPHLKACHRLWNENGGSKIEVFSGISDYGKFFVRRDDLALRVPK